ncbi:MAG: hypothetical protein ACYDEX_20285 [Mobilitalea sp.]
MKRVIKRNQTDLVGINMGQSFLCGMMQRIGKMKTIYIIDLTMVKNSKK